MTIRGYLGGGEAVVPSTVDLGQVLEPTLDTDAPVIFGDRTCLDLIDDANSAYYGYDANDRLTLTSRVLASAPSPETYTYTSGTNRLASVTDASGTRSIGYDGRGNTASETRPGSAPVSASYDGYGRLLTYTRSGDPAQSNQYNGLDDRVSATSGSTTRGYVYDPDGRMLGEYGASASDVVAETIWLQPRVAANDNAPLGGDDGIGGYAPLAVATGSGSGAALSWVHGNHLGVPIVTTDASGASVTPAGYTLPGFPGQTRTLADLYYNRYRDYDTATGRYIQADPIGLEGGSNPYVYADGNPLRNVDPLGLRATAVQVMDVAVGEFWNRQILPSRRINKWLTVGDAIGTAMGAAIWYCSQDGGDDRCRPHYEEIKRRTDILRRRLVQFRGDDLKLPEVNPPGAKGRTRAGEANAFYNDQAGLREAIRKALADGCTNIAPESWRLATMPLNQRYPGPPRPTEKYHR